MNDYKARRANKIAKDLRTKKYRQRVVKDKSKYERKRKYKDYIDEDEIEIKQ